MHLDVAGRRRRTRCGCMATYDGGCGLRARCGIEPTRCARGRARAYRSPYAAPAGRRAQGWSLPRARALLRARPPRPRRPGKAIARKSTSTTIWGIVLDSGTVGHVLEPRTRYYSDGTVACAYCRCGVGAHSQTPHRRCRGAGIVSARWEPLRIGHPLAQLDARPRALT